MEYSDLKYSDLKILGLRYSDFICKEKRIVHLAMSRVELYNNFCCVTWLTVQYSAAVGVYAAPEITRTVVLYSLFNNRPEPHI